jgi:hypothetical protein
MVAVCLGGEDQSSGEGARDLTRMLLAFPRSPEKFWRKCARSDRVTCAGMRRARKVSGVDPVSMEVHLSSFKLAMDGTDGMVVEVAAVPLMLGRKCECGAS